MIKLQIDPQFFQYCAENLSPLKHNFSYQINCNQLIDPEPQLMLSIHKEESIIRIANQNSEFLTPPYQKEQTYFQQDSFMISEFSIKKSKQTDINQFDHIINFTVKKQQIFDDAILKENSTQKTCYCRKSRCLKRYCDCFAAGQDCNQNCKCKDCLNKPQHDAIRSVTKNKHISSIINKEIFCTCIKSHCQKKYCECFNAGHQCSNKCKCQECYNQKSIQNNFDTIKKSNNQKQLLIL